MSSEGNLQFKAGAVAGGMVGVIVGVLLSASIALSQPSKEPEKEVVYKEKKVTTTVTVNRLPEDCKTALLLADKMLKQVYAVAQTSGEQQNILHSAKQAIITKDAEQLNNVLQKQYDLDRKTIGPLSTISDDTAVFQVAQKRCSQSLQGGK